MFLSKILLLGLEELVLFLNLGPEELLLKRKLLILRLRNSICRRRWWCWWLLMLELIRCWS